MTIDHLLPLERLKVLKHKIISFSCLLQLSLSLASVSLVGLTVSLRPHHLPLEFTQDFSLGELHTKPVRPLLLPGTSAKAVMLPGGIGPSFSPPSGTHPNEPPVGSRVEDRPPLQDRWTSYSTRSDPAQWCSPTAVMTPVWSHSLVTGAWMSTCCPTLSSGRFRTLVVSLLRLLCQLAFFAFVWTISWILSQQIVASNFGLDWEEALEIG